MAPDSISASNPVLSGLIRKRQEIAAELDGVQARLRQLILDIDAVDATIRLFQPDIDLNVVKVCPSPSISLASTAKALAAAGLGA